MFPTTSTCPLITHTVLSACPSNLSCALLLASCVTSSYASAAFELSAAHTIMLTLHGAFCRVTHAPPCICMCSPRTACLPALHCCPALCSSVAAMETVHKAQLEAQQAIVVRFEALDKELVLVPVKVKTGTHRDSQVLPPLHLMSRVVMQKLHWTQNALFLCRFGLGCV